MNRGNKGVTGAHWYPLLFLAVLFLLDKAFLFPEVRACCTRLPVERLFPASLNDTSPDSDSLLTARRAGKRIAVNMGSSMSGGYDGWNGSGREAADRPDLATDVEVNRWHVVNLAYPDASALTHFVRFEQMLDRGITPDLWMIEFSPATVNARSPFLEAEISNTMSAWFALRHVGQLHREHLGQNLLHRLIVSLRYQPGRPVRVTGLPDAHRAAPPGNDPHGSVNAPGHETEGEAGRRQAMEAMHLTVLESLFRQYRADDRLVDYVVQMVHRARERNVDLVLWNPRLHPAAHAVVASSQNAREWGRVTRRLEQAGAILVDMNLPDFSCDRFSDPTHLDAVCFRELLSWTLREGLGGGGRLRKNRGG